MKKILSLILVLSMLCSFPVITHSEDVAEDSDGEAVETLVALGIMEGSGGDLMLDKVLTRAEFVTMLMRVMNSEYQNDSMYFEDVPKSHWAFTDISTACMMGIVQGNEEKKFQPDRPVVYEEMVKMLVCALGYGTYASLKGGYPAGYMAVAQQKDLFDKALGRQGLIVKRHLAAQMIFNALDVPLMQENGFGEYIETELDASKTLLSQNMKIRKGEGIVKANSVTSLSQSGGVSDGLVQIGNKTFREGVSNALWQLGYTVTYYADISETEDTPPLIYSRIAENKNEVITVNDNDIADNCTKREFIYKSEGKSRKFSIDFYADLIYNGVSTGGFTAADLKSASGSVTLIDNDNDRDADVILVSDYVTILVGSYNTASYMAYDRDDVNKFIELDPESDDYNSIIYENGEECRFSLVRENSVLSVAKSKNLTGKKSITAMLSNESVSGVFEAVDTTDNIAVIDGVEYRMLSGVYAKIKDYMGQSITLYLDAFGNIAGADDRIISKFSYGYLIEAAAKGSISQQTQFKILTETGDVEIINGAKKISLDANSAISGSEIPSKLTTTARSGGTEKDQLIRYRLNQDGEINAIDTVAIGKGGDADSLSKDIEYKGGEKLSDRRRYIGNLFGYEKAEFTVDDNVLVFAIPKPAEKSEDTKYEVYGKSYFVQNEYYELEAYDLEDDMTVAACIIQDAAVEEVSDLARVVIVDNTNKVEKTEVSRLVDTAANVSAANQKYYLWLTENQSNFIAESAATDNTKPFYHRPWLSDKEKSDIASRKMVYYKTNKDGRITTILVPDIPDTKHNKLTLMNTAGRYGYTYVSGAYLVYDPSAGDESITGGNDYIKIAEDATVFSGIALDYSEDNFNVRDVKILNATTTKMWMYSVEGSAEARIILRYTPLPREWTSSLTMVVVKSVSPQKDGSYQLKGYSKGAEYSDTILPNTRLVERQLSSSNSSYVPIKQTDIRKYVATDFGGNGERCYDYSTFAGATHQYADNESIKRGDILLVGKDYRTGICYVEVAMRAENCVQLYPSAQSSFVGRLKSKSIQKGIVTGYTRTGEILVNTVGQYHKEAARTTTPKADYLLKQNGTSDGSFYYDRKMPYNFTACKSVWIYDYSSKTMETATYSDIMIGDILMVTGSALAPLDCIILRNNPNEPSFDYWNETPVIPDTPDEPDEPVIPPETLESGYIIYEKYNGYKQSDSITKLKTDGTVGGNATYTLNGNAENSLTFNTSDANVTDTCIKIPYAGVFNRSIIIDLKTPIEMCSNIGGDPLSGEIVVEWDMMFKSMLDQDFFTIRLMNDTAKTVEEKGCFGLKNNTAFAAGTFHTCKIVLNKADWTYKMYIGDTLVKTVNAQKDADAFSRLMIFTQQNNSASTSDNVVYIDNLRISERASE